MSFQINGVLIDVAKHLGGGHKEKIYCNAIAAGFERRSIQFSREVYVPMVYNDIMIGKYFIDFVVEGVIAIEIKRNQFVSGLIITQTKQYLSALNLRLGIIGAFTYNSGVVIKRVVNHDLIK